MRLFELNLLYSKVSDRFGFGEGIIFGLYAIYTENKVQFLVEIKYKKDKAEKIGLFPFDIENKRIELYSKEDYIKILNYISTVNKKNNYEKIKNILEKSNNDIIAYNNYFIIVAKESNVKYLDAKSNLIFKEINYHVTPTISVLYSNPGLSTVFAQIDSKYYNDLKFKSINYSTDIELNIEYSDKTISDHGNIKNIIVDDDKLNIIIESIMTTLLETVILPEVCFENVAANEVIGFMSFSSNSFKVGEVSPSSKMKRKYKYITVLNNFELNIDRLLIGEIEISKNIVGVDVTKLKADTSKFAYISTYVVADDISEAQILAFKKIHDLICFIELVEKNSCFNELYNSKDSVNLWNIKKLFIDFKISSNFYIFNILDQKQKVYGTTSNIFVKNYGVIGEENEIAKYSEEISKKIYNYDESLGKIFNAIYWLNKGIDEINMDLNRCVIYLNIALEYCVSGEKGITLVEKYDSAKTIFEDMIEYLNNKYNDDNSIKEIIDLLKSTINSSTVKNRFENMLKKLGIEYTDNQFKNYNKIRDARNDIIHGRKKVDIEKIDIIQFYMFLSKVMFYKVMGEQK